MPSVSIKEGDQIYVTATTSGETMIGMVVEVEPHEDGSTTLYLDTKGGSRIVLGVVPFGTEFEKASSDA
jgi:hypothetical protein